MGTPKAHPTRPKRILVIGGGPTGLVALRNLINRGEFDHIELVERRDDVGGVWYLDDAKNHNNCSTSNRPRWPSPAYPGLVGNVLPEFLSYSEYPFPKSPRPQQPFPTLAETHQYLRDFAEPLVHSGAIRLNMEAHAVEELPGGGWRVRMRDWSGEQVAEIEEVWDGVVVANGWYDTPVWPGTEGLAELRSLGLAKHAKWYRGPTEYEGKRCLIIGNANSSNDMAAQLLPVAQKPIYQSIRRPTFPGFPYIPDPEIVMVAPVAKYSPCHQKDANGPTKVTAHLTDGTDIENIDIVLVGTGYKPFPNFVQVIDASQNPAALVPLVTLCTAPERIPSLHRHILYAHNPSLAFVGAPMSFTPFTLADVSSTWIALAWSATGGVTYPDTAEGRLAFEKARIAEIEKQKDAIDNPTAFISYMVLASEEQGYAAGLRAEVVYAQPELDEVLPVWSDEKTGQREGMWPVKLEALKWAREHGSYGNVDLGLSEEGSVLS